MLLFYFTGTLQEERFRVSANGTVSIIAPYTYTGGIPWGAALSFHMASHTYVGGIICTDRKMTVSACSGIDFWGSAQNTGTPHFQ